MDSRTLAALGLALLVALPLPSMATHGGANPLLAQGGDAGPGWRWFTVTSTGGRFFLDLTAEGHYYANQLGVWLYDGQRTFAGGFGFTVFGPEAGLHAYSAPLPGVGQGVTLFHPTINGPGFMGMGSTVTGTGTFHVLAWSAGEATRWSFELRGEPGAALARVDAGRGAFLFTSQHFEGPANAQVRLLGPSARAELLAHRPLDVRGTLLATYLGGASNGVDLHSLSASTPAGERNCPCTFSALTGAQAAGAGRYTFKLEGAGAGLFDEVWASGVDIVLPG